MIPQDARPPSKSKPTLSIHESIDNPYPTQFPHLKDIPEEHRYRDQPQQVTLYHYITFHLNNLEDKSVVSGKHIYQEIEVPPNFTQQHFRLIRDHYETMSLAFQQCQDSSIVYQPVRFFNRTEEEVIGQSRRIITGLSVVTEALDNMVPLSKVIFDRDNPNLKDVDLITPDEMIDFSKKITKTIKFLNQKSKGSLAFGDISPYSILVGYDKMNKSQRTVRIIDTFCDRFVSSLRKPSKVGPKTFLRNAYCSRSVILQSSNSGGHYEPKFQDDVWSTKMAIYSIEHGKSFVFGETIERLLANIDEIANGNHDIIKHRISQTENVDSYLHLADSSLYHNNSQCFSKLQSSIDQTECIIDSQIKVGKLEQSQIQERIEEVSEKVTLPHIQDPQWEIQTPCDENLFFVPQSINKAVEKASSLDKDSSKIEEFMLRVLVSLLPLSMQYVKYEGDDKITGNYSVIIPKGQNQIKEMKNEKVLQGTAYIKEPSKKLKKQLVFFLSEGLQPINPPVDKPIKLEKSKKIQPHQVVHFNSESVTKLKERHENIKKRVQELNIKDEVAHMFMLRKNKFEQAFRSKNRLSLMTYNQSQKTQQQFIKIQMIPILSVRFTDLQQLVLRNNNLDDYDVKLMVEQQFPVLRSLKALDLADNNIKDGLNIMLESTLYFHQPFRSVERLNLQGNLINSVLCFMNHYRMPNLAYLHLGRNKIDQEPMYNDCFRAIRDNQNSRIFLGGNPFIKELLKKPIEFINEDLETRKKCRVSFEALQQIQIKMKIDEHEQKTGRTLPTSSRRETSLLETAIGQNL